MVVVPLYKIVNNLQSEPMLTNLCLMYLSYQVLISYQTQLNSKVELNWTISLDFILLFSFLNS